MLLSQVVFSKFVRQRSGFSATLREIGGSRIGLRKKSHGGAGPTQPRLFPMLSVPLTFSLPFPATGYRWSWEGPRPQARCSGWLWGTLRQLTAGGHVHTPLPAAGPGVKPRRKVKVWFHDQHFKLFMLIGPMVLKFIY